MVCAYISKHAYTMQNSSLFPKLILVKTDHPAYTHCWSSRGIQGHWPSSFNLIPIIPLFTVWRSASTTRPTIDQWRWRTHLGQHFRWMTSTMCPWHSGGTIESRGQIMTNIGRCDLWIFAFQSCIIWKECILQIENPHLNSEA